MMRTTARLHANLTTRLNRLEEDSEPICSRQFPSPYHLLVAIDPMHLKYRLCQIYANTHKLHGGPLLSVNWSMTLPVWHLDAVQVRRGPSHCFDTNSPNNGRLWESLGLAHQCFRRTAANSPGVENGKVGFGKH